MCYVKFTFFLETCQEFYCKKYTKNLQNPCDRVVNKGCYNCNKSKYFFCYHVFMAEKKLTSSIEDYLETIYEQLEKAHKIKAVDIAKKMNISRASVTEALQKLAQKEYIIYEKNHPIELTEKGVTIAKEVIHKHRILCDFFTKILKTDIEDAEINACRIEHVITQTAFDKISKLVENLD